MAKTAANKEGGNGQAGAEQSQEPNSRELQALAFRIKEAIDQRGKYSYRMNDMAAGFSAAREVSHSSARRAIEEGFRSEFGQTPKEYLNERHQERIAAGEGGFSRIFNRER